MPDKALKLVCALHSRSDVVEFVADKCPICPAVQSQVQSLPQSDVLEQINEKLGLIQDISKKVNGVIEKLDDLNEICKNLRKDYESLDKRVTLQLKMLLPPLLLRKFVQM
ncbi:hypothetical protein KQX54_002347 [Cotesia glomerata]|uniref:Uncharacterized protein n=1 Tax=Cotesia glomerata TaxID=32391 RepID=A0AAV7IQA4_COTGL|nr:hypothetical protein KQX54_002347 [Cotesia glomerata]